MEISWCGKKAERTTILKHISQETERNGCEKKIERAGMDKKRRETKQWPGEKYFLGPDSKRRRKYMKCSAK